MTLPPDARAQDGEAAKDGQNRGPDRTGILPGEREGVGAARPPLPFPGTADQVIEPLKFTPAAIIEPPPIADPLYFRTRHSFRSMVFHKGRLSRWRTALRNVWLAAGAALCLMGAHAWRYRTSLTAEETRRPSRDSWLRRCQRCHGLAVEAKGRDGERSWRDVW